MRWESRRRKERGDTATVRPKRDAAPAGYTGSQQTVQRPDLSPSSSDSHDVPSRSRVSCIIDSPLAVVLATARIEWVRLFFSLAASEDCVSRRATSTSAARTPSYRHRRRRPFHQRALMFRSLSLSLSLFLSLSRITGDVISSFFFLTVIFPNVLRSAASLFWLPVMHLPRREADVKISKWKFTWPWQKLCRSLFTDEKSYKYDELSDRAARVN